MSKRCGLRLDYGRMMAGVIGPEHGISEAEIASVEVRGRDAVNALRACAEKGKIGFARLPFQTKIAGEISRVASEISSEVENFVVLGIGGSALGNIALHAALNHPFHNILPRSKRGGPRVFVIDNVDPEFVAGAMDILDLESTAVNIVTKSGSTAETMAQCMIFLKEMEKRIGKKRMRGRVIATTDPERGALRELAMREGYRCLSIPPDVGGRFSAFSPVGLLSAAVSGIRIDDLLEGARIMHGFAFKPEVRSNPALAAAILHYISYVEKKKTIAVMMPYCNALCGIADWFRQLWAESLGKRLDRSGKEVEVGQTPVRALGTTDQHSQIQLYMEGPADKMVTFIGVKRYRRELSIPESPLDDDAFAYLAGKTMNKLILSEQRATAMALARAGRPSMTLELDSLDERSAGMLLYMLEVQTVIAAELYGINAYDQPGVEEGKELTYAMMGRKGYERMREKISPAARERAFVVEVP